MSELTPEGRKKNIERFPKRGRLIFARGKEWRYRVGKGGMVTICCEDGERICVGAWTIKGTTPDLFDRGKYKKTGDGMLMPGHVKQWLANRRADK